MVRLGAGCEWRNRGWLVSKQSCLSYRRSPRRRCGIIGIREFTGDGCTYAYWCTHITGDNRSQLCCGSQRTGSDCWGHAYNRRQYQRGRRRHHTRQDSRFVMSNKPDQTSVRDQEAGSTYVTPTHTTADGYESGYGSIMVHMYRQSFHAETRCVRPRKSSVYIPIYMMLGRQWTDGDCVG